MSTAAAALKIDFDFDLDRVKIRPSRKLSEEQARILREAGEDLVRERIAYLLSIGAVSASQVQAGYSRLMRAARAQLGRAR